MDSESALSLVECLHSESSTSAFTFPLDVFPNVQPTQDTRRHYVMKPFYRGQDDLRLTSGHLKQVPIGLWILQLGLYFSKCREVL